MIVVPARPQRHDVRNAVKRRTAALNQQIYAVSVQRRVRPCARTIKTIIDDALGVPKACVPDARTREMVRL